MTFPRIFGDKEKNQIKIYVDELKPFETKSINNKNKKYSIKNN